MCVCVCMNVCMYVRTYVRTYVCVCISLYLLIHGIGHMFITKLHQVIIRPAQDLGWNPTEAQLVLLGLLLLGSSDRRVRGWTLLWEKSWQMVSPKWESHLRMMFSTSMIILCLC